MKLNYKRTIFVGFAFFLISAFWQAYDSTIPLILTNKFGLPQTASGVIMALDNILALFMLPLFGAISDRCTSKLGRRTPFILVGTILAAALLVGLSFVDGWQLSAIDAVAATDDPAALSVIYESQADAELMTPEGERFVLSERFTEEEFCAVGTDTAAEAYTQFVVPARQAYALTVTKASPAPLIVFIVILLLLLIAMATFRTPAVALMPDVTVKPLRSKGNAVINLMGSAGGILILVLGMVFATGTAENAMMSYTPYYAVIAGLMLAALGLFMWKVREPRFVREMHEQSRRYGIEEADEVTDKHRKLGKGERRSMCFLLTSIVLWFMGFNAVTSKYSVYAANILNMDYNMTLIIAQAAAIVAYLPVGIVSSKLGRKKTIIAGVIMLTTAFGVACFLREDSSILTMNAIFALAGIGWATINVNSFPMVVEMCGGGDVGRFTGIYYTASMAAQTVTPMLSGALMDRFGMTILFPYATVFAGLAIVTMLFVMHGDSKPTAKRGLEAMDVED